ncbi:expressed unknown protein [Seminavis robusta]|uniref:Uncharacterized protein n=1 Tax=Seminavis robusta TaxID=568900 RepID=A0A9N8HEK1_9STRA|nr:expressed unknown protein [Seminavis robusta]|eukprot:Sro477_g150890.1 n/a (154) ;mRNA; r:56063-56524
MASRLRWSHRMTASTRFKSMATAESQQEQNSSLASPSISSVNTNHSLIKVPSVPIFGSTLSMFSGTPPLNKNKFLQWWAALHDSYGDFYQIGIPGIGAGQQGITHVISDPKEMMKVLKQEGTHPSGLVEAHWATKAYFNDRGYAVAEMYSRGE